MDTSGVNPRYDEVSSDVPLVAEKVLFNESHASDNARFTTGRERMEFELRGDYSGDKFGTGMGG